MFFSIIVFWSEKSDIFFYKYQSFVFTNIKRDNYSHCLITRIDITMQFDSITMKYAGGAITRNLLLWISGNYRARERAANKSPRWWWKNLGHVAIDLHSFCEKNDAATVAAFDSLIVKKRQRKRQMERARVSLLASGKWRCDLGKGDHLPIPARRTGQLQVAGGRNSIKS